ncbi:ribonuclease H2, subunit C [Pseudohyphozyma bogoriensis]|nr:ribonuclease H2, subunit C [Pseudohyphozyma bogoriensis]
MVAPPPVVLSQKETTPLPFVSLLPCRISHDGPANIRQFFATRPHASSSTSATSASPSLSASFRGRLLISTPFSVPSEYQGIVFTTTKPAPKQDASRRAMEDEDEEEKKRLKKRARMMMSPSRTKQSTKVVAVGTRRSPRRKAAPKFSMDSDEEHEGEGGEMAVEEVEETVVVEEKVVIEADAVKNEEEMPLQPSSPVMVDAPILPDPPSLTLFAHSSLTQTIEISTPTTPITESESGSQLLPAPTDDDERLARDVQYLVPTATFDTIQIWNADYQLDKQEDVYAKAINEWFGVAEMIHAY